MIEVQHFFPDLNVVHLEQLSHNFAKMFKVREHDAIMTIVVNQQGYFAHKHILLSSSSYLRYISSLFVYIQANSTVFNLQLIINNFV